MDTTNELIRLDLEKATAEAVRPFGELIGATPRAESRVSAFYEEKVKLFTPPGFIADEDTEVTLARLQRRPMRVRWMERHFKHTQAFIPLGGRPFAMVLAPPNNAELPEMSKVKALLFDGTAGFAMHVGTWHEFPFSFVDDTDIAVILRREATRGLRTEAIVDGESRNPDIDKKDIGRRLRVTMEIAA